MAKKYQTKNPALILKGVEITIVARKEGEDDREANMIYEKALDARKEFLKAGWKVDLYQKGFNK